MITLELESFGLTITYDPQNNKENVIAPLLYVLDRLFDWSFSESETELYFDEESNLPAGIDGKTTNSWSLQDNYWNITIEINKDLVNREHTPENILYLAQVLLHELSHAEQYATCRYDSPGEQHGPAFIETAEAHGLKVIYDRAGNYKTTKLLPETALVIYKILCQPQG